MAPLPKRRHSSARQAQRTRALLRPSVGLVACAQCHEMSLPHTVCRNCGYYDGRVVVVKKQKEQKK